MTDTKGKTNSKLKRFIKQAYAYKFFNSFILLYPLYAIMFKDHGMSDTEVSILLIFWSIGSIIFQIPCGLIADKYSRKNMILLGQAMKVCCFAVWLIFPNFIGFLTGFLMWGFQWAVNNSVFEALVYEELKSFRKRKLYAKVSGRNQAIHTIGEVTSAFGSLLIFLGYDIITYLSMASVISSFVVVLCMKPNSKRKNKPNLSYLKILRQGINILKKEPKIFFIIVLLTTIIGLAYIDEYFGLIGLEMGFNKQYVGFIFASVLIMESLGGFIAHKFEGIPDSILYLGVIILGFIFISISLVYNIYGIIILAAFYFLYSIIKVLLFAKFQHSIKSNTRGTVLAFYSLFEQISSIGSYAVMMIAAALGSYKFGFLMLGSIVAVLGLIYTFVDTKTRNDSEENING
ncbi:MAG: MFS transporter [Lactobacillaceae bacterium]|nr:MFS transporter [Lactobacillaceae bacterium]